MLSRGGTKSIPLPSLARSKCSMQTELGNGKRQQRGGEEAGGVGSLVVAEAAGTEMETPHLSHPGSGFSPRAPPWERCQQQTRPQKRVGSRRRGEPTDPWSARPGKRELPGDPGQEHGSTA